MKASLLAVIFVLSALLLHAQSSDMNLHFPRSGDVMYYLDFKAADVVMEYGGDGQVWDFSKAEMIDNGNCVSFSINNPTFHYFTQDHLGNNRIVLNEDGTVEQIMHYYPFGGAFNDAGLNPEFQQYKYNGKELCRTLGLDTYDYGARQYFSALPMWDRMDPKCEEDYSESPYAYCRNNSMKFIDNEGRKIIFASGSTEIFKNMFNQAISYLKQYGCDNLYQTLENSEEIFIMHEAIGNTANSFSYRDGIIDWNPTKGLYTTFTILSPTVLLNHEFDHAVEWLKSPNDFSEKIRILPDNDIDADYHTKDDKRVINGSEKETAKKLGELDESTSITRLDHGGFPVKTVSPISNQTDDELPGVTIYH